MIKQIYILLWILLGVFGNPAESLAQGMYAPGVEMACCMEEDSDVMDCCLSMDDSCASSECKCPVLSLITCIPTHGTWNIEQAFSFQNSFFYKDVCLSTGFSRIWLPPKIA